MHGLNQVQITVATKTLQLSNSGFDSSIKRQKTEKVERIDWQKCVSEITVEFESNFFDSWEERKDFTSVQRAMNEAKNKLSKWKPSKNKSWMTEETLRQVELR